MSLQPQIIVTEVHRVGYVSDAPPPTPVPGYGFGLGPFGSGPFGGSPS